MFKSWKVEHPNFILKLVAEAVLRICVILGGRKSKLLVGIAVLIQMSNFE